MKTVSVNLLPTEVILKRRHNSKLQLINRLSVVLLILLIFLASVTLALRISQSLDLQKTNENMVYAQDKVISLNETEGELLLLKQRLSAIKSIKGTDDQKKAIFNLVVNLTPQDLNISDMSVDKTGKLIVSITGTNLSSFNNLIDSLADPEVNLGQIAKVDSDGLSYDKTGIYYLGLKITPKKG